MTVCLIHGSSIRCLDIYKIDPAIKELLKTQMQKGTMAITLKHSEGEIHLPDANVKRRIFQGDNLSPLLFCITIDHLSKLIKKENTSTTPSCSGPIPSQKSRANSVPGIIFFHLVFEMNFNYFHRFS